MADNGTRQSSMREYTSGCSDLLPAPCPFPVTAPVAVTPNPTPFANPLPTPETSVKNRMATPDPASPPSAAPEAVDVDVSSRSNDNVTRFRPEETHSMGGSQHHLEIERDASSPNDSCRFPRQAPPTKQQRPFVDDNHRLRYQDVQDEMHCHESAQGKFKTNNAIIEKSVCENGSDRFG